MFCAPLRKKTVTYPEVIIYLSVKYFVPPISHKSFETLIPQLPHSPKILMVLLNCSSTTRLHNLICMLGQIYNETVGIHREHPWYISRYIWKYLEISETGL